MTKRKKLTYKKKRRQTYLKKKKENREIKGRELRDHRGIIFASLHTIIKNKMGNIFKSGKNSRSCKWREILIQKSRILFSTWREYLYSQPKK